jgi:hypothetical protein
MRSVKRIVVKPITSAEWAFDVIDGPAGFEMEKKIEFLERTKRSFSLSETLRFHLVPHKSRWINTVIEVKIVSVKKSDDFPVFRGVDHPMFAVPVFTLSGIWIDAHLKDRPFAFKGVYSPLARSGKLVFSFKYGRWVVCDDFNHGMGIFYRNKLYVYER